MYKIIVSLLVFFTVVMLSSCGDKCESVVCQNDGFCDDGSCVCPEGVEGGLCETLVRSRILGTYTVFSGCDEGVTPTEEWVILAGGSSNNEILISNFHNPGFDIAAKVVSVNLFEINDQSVTSGGVEYVFNGTGAISRDSSFTVNYTMTTDTSATLIACNAGATRQ